MFQQKIHEGIKLNQDKILSLQRELDHERSENRNLKNILREKQISTSITAFPAPLSIPPFSTLLSSIRNSSVPIPFSTPNSPISPVTDRIIHMNRKMKQLKQENERLKKEIKAKDKEIKS